MATFIVQLIINVTMIATTVLVMIIRIRTVKIWAFSRFLPEELVGGYTEVQKAWQAWTFVDFGQKSSVQDGRAEGGVAATDCACVGFGAIRAGGFLPVEAAGG